ncbi:unnamed protein product [Camellia sinensis]
MCSFVEFLSLYTFVLVNGGLWVLYKTCFEEEEPSYPKLKSTTDGPFLSEYQLI